MPCMGKGGNIIKGVSPFDIKVTGPLVEEPGERGFEPTRCGRASLARSLVFARVVQATEGNTTQRKRKFVERYPPVPCLTKHRRKRQKIQLHFARKL